MIVVFALLASALLSAVLIVALKPLLVRYALARPNARSSHKAPTPQGGGIAVLAATVTPTVDPVNMALVMLPMSLLYFISIGLSYIAYAGRRKNLPTAEESV